MPKITQLLLLLSLLSVPYCLSLGDVTVPSNSSCYNDTNTNICLLLSDTTLTVTMTLSSYGYFALLYSSEMHMGDFSVVQILNGVPELGDYHSTGGHAKPVPDTANNLNLLGYETDLATYVTVKFARLLNTGDPEDQVLARGANFGFAYAFRKGSLLLAQHKHGEEVTFSGLLENGQAYGGMTQREKLFYHGVTLTVLWYVLADLAIWVKYQLWIGQRVTIHAFLMGVCVFISALVVAGMIKEMKPDERVLDTKPKLHYLNGRIIFVWVILQAIGGIASRVLQPKPDLPPESLQRVRKMHRYSGYSLIVLAKINVIIGWTMYHKLYAFILICFESGLLYLQWRMYQRVASGDVGTNVFEHPTQTLSQSAASGGISPALLFQPYNCMEVQSARFFIFDDMVYKIPQQNFHPGGQRIIQQIAGRQVDRFLYGLSHLQVYPQFSPFVHPRQSLQILGNPCGFLPPNDICKLTTQNFSVKERINLTPHLSIFYFKPIGGTVKFGTIKNLRHIGQYYTVRGFQKTRLYTSVLSERKDAKLLRAKILQLITPTNKRLSQQIKQNFLEGVTNQKQVQLQPLDPETLPLLIKRYPQLDSFTNQLYGNMGTPITIRGPKGRGLCIQSIPKGQIAVIAGGTGIFPFLDLIDIIFRLIANVNLSQQQRGVYSRCLDGRSFIFFLSVTTVGDLVMPDELSFIAHSKHPLAKVYVRISQDSVPPSGFMEQLLNVHERFGDRFVTKYILPLTNLEMVYLCGKQNMYREVDLALREAGIPPYKIFFV